MAENTAKASVYLDDNQAALKLKELAEAADQFAQKMNECRKANDKAGFKENEKLYKESKKELDTYKRSIVDVSAVLNNLSGVSYNNLIKAQRTLRSEINGMTKNTKEEIALYNSKVSALKKVDAEINKVKGEMREHREGSNLLMNTFRQLIPVMGLGAGLAGAFNFLKGVIFSTDTAADKFEATMGGLKEAFNFIKQSIATLDFSNLITGFRDAYKAGKQYAEALDLIGDLQRSIGIQKIDIEMEIAKQRTIAKNRSLDIKDREAALAKIIELEKKKMDIVKEVADFELAETAKLILSRDKSGKVTQEQLVDIISNYKAYNSIIEEGIGLQKELDENSKSYYTNARTGMGGWVQDSQKYKAAYDALTDSQKEAIDIANIANLVADDQRDNFARTVSASKQAALELSQSQEALVRLQNSLRSELLKEEDEDGEGGGSDNKGDTEFDKWKADQDKIFIKKNKYITSKIEEQAIILGEAHQASLEEFGDPLVIPSEETVEDEMTYLMEKYHETVDGRLAINQAYYDADIISQTEYEDKKKAILDEEAAYHKAIQDKKLQQAQVYFQGAQSFMDSLMKFNIAAMNKELKAAGNNEKKKEEIQKKYAQQQKSIAIIQAIINTALGVTSALTMMPPASYIFAALTAIAGAAEVAVISSQQFAEGNYADIIGAKDGKRYRAKVVGSDHPSGLFSEPTYVPGFGLFGETKRPELVFNPADSDKIINSQGAINAINMALGKQPQYAQGNTREIIKETRSETFTDPVMLSAINRLNENIERGINAKVVTTEDNLETWNRAQTDLSSFKSKVNG